MGVEVAVGMAIAAVALVVVLGSLAGMILNAYQVASLFHSYQPLAYVRVSSALLAANNRTLLVNITNYGQEPLYLVEDTYVIVLYYTSTGPEVQVFNLTSSPPVLYFVGSYSARYSAGSGLMPGETLELNLTLSQQALRTQPITVTVVPLKAPPAQYTFTPGPLA